MDKTLDILVQLIVNLNLDVLETIESPGRAERRSRLPGRILDGPLSSSLTAIAPDKTVWSHQSVALERLCDDENIVVSTGTGSGKSLVFQLYAFHRILEDEGAKVLVFYPLKALSSDQFARWQVMAKDVGIDPSVVVRIDGDTHMHERDQALESGRVVLMTPDVCQAWLMRGVGSSLTRRFLERLTLLVLDEAHVYESVFGSNVAFLMRRMLSARRRASRASSELRRLQVVAATATIAEAADHLAHLTGLRFAKSSGKTQTERLSNLDGFYKRSRIWRRIETHLFERP